MKLFVGKKLIGGATVAPFTGAWIETGLESPSFDFFQKVAPFTGAWIETYNPKTRYQKSKVAPFTGAWIETLIIARSRFGDGCRTLHGCVD